MPKCTPSLLFPAQCVNGTYSEEKCANGLIFTGHGYVHNHCNYNWAGDCGKLVYDDTPISSPGCLYAYGIYPVGEGCQKTFFKVCKLISREEIHFIIGFL